MYNTKQSDCSSQRKSDTLRSIHSSAHFHSCFCRFTIFVRKHSRATRAVSMCEFSLVFVCIAPCRPWRFWHTPKKWIDILHKHFARVFLDASQTWRWCDDDRPDRQDEAQLCGTQEQDTQPTTTKNSNTTFIVAVFVGWASSWVYVQRTVYTH